MAQVGVSEASKLVGISRRSMYRAMESGKVSYVTDGTGTKKIEIVELIRAFGDIKHQAPQPVAQFGTDEMITKLLAEIRSLHDKIDALSERVPALPAPTDEQESAHPSCAKNDVSAQVAHPSAQSLWKRIWRRKKD